MVNQTGIIRHLTELYGNRIALAFIPLMLLATPVKSAENQTSPSQAENSAPVVVGSQSAENLDAVTKTFKQAGVQRCLGRIQQVTNFLTDGSSASAGFLFMPPSQQDSSFLSVSMEIATPKEFSYVSTNFHPRDNQCAGEYETVTYWKTSCKGLADKTYAKLPKKGTLQSKIIVLDGGPNMRVFLMPAGAGCVAIKKEVIY